VVEGTGLENRQARKRLEGSNPSPSAMILSSVVHSRPLREETKRKNSIWLSGLDCHGPLLSTLKVWVRVWMRWPRTSISCLR
jgi:hypothetical protein